MLYLIFECNTYENCIPNAIIAYNWNCNSFIKNWNTIRSQIITIIISVTLLPFTLKKGKRCLKISSCWKTGIYYLFIYSFIYFENRFKRRGGRSKNFNALKYCIKTETLNHLITLLIHTWNHFSITIVKKYVSVI